MPPNIPQNPPSPVGDDTFEDLFGPPSPAPDPEQASTSYKSPYAQPELETDLGAEQDGHLEAFQSLIADHYMREGTSVAGGSTISPETAPVALPIPIPVHSNTRIAAAPVRMPAPVRISAPKPALPRATGTISRAAFSQFSQYPNPPPRKQQSQAQPRKRADSLSPSPPYEPESSAKRAKTVAGPSRPPQYARRGGGKFSAISRSNGPLSKSSHTPVEREKTPNLSSGSMQNMYDANTPVLRNRSATTPRYTHSEYAEILDDSDSSIYGPSAPKVTKPSHHEPHIKEDVGDDDDDDDDGEILYVDSRPQLTISKPAVKHRPKPKSKPAKRPGPKPRANTARKPAGKPLIACDRCKASLIAWRKTKCDAAPGQCTPCKRDNEICVTTKSNGVVQPGSKPARRSAFAGAADDTVFLNNDDGELGQPPPANLPRKFVVGLDYGTTFTSVAYVAHAIDDKTPRFTSKEVKNIINWPEDGNGGARAQVPTEMWYSPVPITRDAPVDYDESGSEDEHPVARNSNHSGGGESSNRGRGAALLESTLRDRASSTSSHEESSAHLWGYEAYHQMYAANIERGTMGHIARAKLMLVNSKHTVDDRKRVRPQLEYLIGKGTIRKHSTTDNVSLPDVQDVITDFLVNVLSHTKQQLIELEGFTEDCQISFSLTVPTIWSVRSSRILQASMQEAINIAQFGSLSSLFIVSEPEAAATFLLGNTHTMLAGESFTILDCGGGTVDGVTYTVTNSYPLRLKVEVGKPSGDNCGASYLNDAFEERLLERLEDEHYLDYNGETREDIVRLAVPEFENRQKRKIDISKRPVGEVRIPGLKGDDSRRAEGLAPKAFRRNYVLMKPNDYSGIFLPLLERTSGVLEDQIEGALAQGKDIKKVFLIGGFGAAPSLRSYLREYLANFPRQRNLPYDIELITTNEQDSVTAIAAGAALRALNLEQGPRRLAFSSYGFLRIEPYQPLIKGLAGHKEAPVKIDPFDDQPYVTVIDYFLQKGDIIPPVSHYQPYKSTHAFDIDAKRFRCEEVLYVNDEDTKSHYSLEHEVNRQAQEAGRIIVDMTFLRDEGYIQPIMPVYDNYGIAHGKPHYEVTYDLIPIVEGRDLRYEARFPPNKNGQVKKTGQVSIAAAFRPGTG
ncbi:hypothetical protein VTL71DRAFT_16506 [Oculimacula yallundae]|uniref:Uncharacterized protein n=1 Tax=Oculimacula yallundae TaxID=86028 RepID=A0ABR4CGV3_9HELO